MSKKPFIQYFDPHKIGTQIAESGLQLIYCREALYPVVEAEVIIREKSREQLGHIEKTILTLIATVPASPQSISSLLGVGGGKLYPVIKELEGRGLIEPNAQGLFCLSQLGELSIQYGVEVVDVERAVLLCGITGNLLPRKLYTSERIQPDQLQFKARALDLLQEENSISLNALDLSNVADRKAVGLPEEAVEVIGVTSHKPIFLKGVLIHYKDKRSAEICEVRFTEGLVDWLPHEKVREFVSEPLGFSVRKSPEQAVEKIERGFEDKGVKLSEPVSLDEYGNPVVRVEEMGEDSLEVKYNGKPFFMYFGSSTNRPLPVGKFPFGGKDAFPGPDLLYGRALSVYASSPELQQKVDILRCADTALRQYNSKRRAERKEKGDAFIHSMMTSSGFDLDEALSVCEKYAPNNVKRMLFGDVR